MKKWYAVQEDRTDAWDNGTYDYAEAVQMLKEQGGGLIAVIDDSTDDPVCLEEIKYDDVVRSYYWLDLDYVYGDHSIKKFALYRGVYDEEGEKDRDSEKVVCWGTYDEICTADDPEDEAPWDAIDEVIEKTLGFVPEYEVG